jgi:hypothetical protein
LVCGEQALSVASMVLRGLEAGYKEEELSSGRFRVYGSDSRGGGSGGSVRVGWIDAGVLVSGRVKGLRC